MNIELASKVVNHIEQFPENHTELHWGEQNELGTVGSIAAYCALFAGIAKIKNQSIVLTEVDNREQDWIKTTQELLEIPFSTAFRMCVLVDDKQALEALKYIANGQLPKWRLICGIQKPLPIIY